MQITAEIKGFEAYLRLERAFSDNSIEAYRRDIEKFAQFINSEFPETLLSEITLTHFSVYLNHLNSLDIAKSSQARNISGLKAFFKYLIEEDIISQNPTELLEAPKNDRKIPEVLTIDEIEAMISALDLSRPDGIRNKAIIEILYGCGLRVSELTDLKLTNYFQSEGILRVTGKGSKMRLVPINTTAIHHLNIYITQVRKIQEIKKKYEDIIFLNRRGSALSRVWVFNIVKDLAKNAGITKNISPHTFRHSFATHLYDGGADLRIIQEMLGHESITTTEIYASVSGQYLRDTLIQFHPRF